MRIQGVIFDLDGVIVSTDEYHYRAWSELADAEGIYFDRKINERLRGVSRMESLEILLEQATRPYSNVDKQTMATHKNDVYKASLIGLTPVDILPGAKELLQALKNMGVKIAIGSSSKNTPFILERVGLTNFFDAVADGNSIQNSKPDPEVFLLAAKLMALDPSACAVVEDAYAGIDAAKAAGCRAVAVGYASGYVKADYCLPDLTAVDINVLLDAP